MACDGICYKLFLKGNSLYLKRSLLLLQFNRNSTSTFLNKSEQLEVISNYSNTDNLEDHVTSLQTGRGNFSFHALHIFFARHFYSMPEQGSIWLNVCIMSALSQKGGPSFSREAAVPASMLMSTCSAVVSLCKTQNSYQLLPCPLTFLQMGQKQRNVPYRNQQSSTLLYAYNTAALLYNVPVLITA